MKIFHLNTSLAQVVRPLPLMYSPKENTMLVCRVRLIWSPVGISWGLMRVLQSIDACFQQLLNILNSWRKILKFYHLSPSISTPHSSQSILAREVMLKGLPMIFVFSGNLSSGSSRHHTSQSAIAVLPLNSPVRYNIRLTFDTFGCFYIS